MVVASKRSAQAEGSAVKERSSRTLTFPLARKWSAHSDWNGAVLETNTQVPSFYFFPFSF
jgi:hypothetical protein